MVVRSSWGYEWGSYEAPRSTTTTGGLPPGSRSIGGGLYVTPDGTIVDQYGRPHRTQPPPGALDPDDGGGDGGTDEPEEPDEPEEEDETTDAQRSAYDQLVGILSVYGLQGLASWGWRQIQQGKSVNEILISLREQPLYKERFLGNFLRQERGFSWMNEAEYLGYMDEAKRISKSLLGASLSENQIAQLIGNNVSLAEWENRLKVFQGFQIYGPVMRRVLEEELGRRIADDEAFATLNPEISTPELERAYDNAYRRGLPAALGLGVRSQIEAEMGRQLGLTAQEQGERYRGVAQQRPLFERLQAIEAMMQEGGTGNDYLNDVPVSKLVAGIVFDDPYAKLELQQQLAREFSRFNQGGGTVYRGSQAVGLLQAGER